MGLHSEFSDKTYNYNYNLYDYVTNPFGFLRLSVMKCLVNHETENKHPFYIAQYIPSTGRILRCPKIWLYYCALNNIPCYGQFFRLPDRQAPLLNKCAETNNLFLNVEIGDDDGISDGSGDDDGDNDGDSLALNIENLFNRCIDTTHDFEGESNEVTITRYKCIKHKVCTCGDDCDDEQEESDEEFTSNALIFDYTSSEFCIVELDKPCGSGIYVCYDVSFPPRTFHHAAGPIECEGMCVETDIVGITKVIKSLHKIHVCVKYSHNEVKHCIKYVSVCGL